jgi:hypothetical protein
MNSNEIQYQAQFHEKFWMHNLTNGNLSISDMGILLKPGERIKIYFGQAVSSADFLIHQNKNRVKLYSEVKQPRINKEVKDVFIIKRNPK